MMTPTAVCVAFFALAATSQSMPPKDRLAATVAGTAILRRAVDTDAMAAAASEAVDYLATRPWLMRVVEQPCANMSKEGDSE